MALELTLEKAQQMVEAVIAEMGADHVYKRGNNGSCTYVHSEYVNEYDSEKAYSKGCIVGHIFITELNLDMGELASLAANEYGAANFVEWLVAKEKISTCKQDAVEYLELLQRSQDARRPWGEAHEQAKLGNFWSNTYNKYV